MQLLETIVSFSGAGGDGRRDVVVVGAGTRLPLVAWSSRLPLVIPVARARPAPKSLFYASYSTFAD